METNPLSSPALTIRATITKGHDGSDGYAVSVSCAVPPWAGRTCHFISPLSAIHFWIIWAIWSEFLSIISM